MLWTSSLSHYRTGAAIRGGVPICFPWFGPDPERRSRPQHGFARLSAWSLDAVSETEERDVEILLSLEPDEATRALWPHRFAARLAVRIGAKLEVALRVENPGESPFSYEAALHAYFAVGDVRRVRLLGLEGCAWLDKAQGGARREGVGVPVAFDRETDRVYVGNRGGCEIVDPVLARRISIQTDGARDAVVWNPWEEKARAMKDFPDDAWPEMLCVEPARLGAHAIALRPGEAHELRCRVVANTLEETAEP